MSPTARRAPRLLIATIAVTGLLLVGLIGWWIGTASLDGQKRALPVLGKAPAWHGLTNQLNEVVDSSRFQGKVELVTFLFPYCRTYCPLIAAHLVGFEDTLARASIDNRVELIAFNVDPAGAGPKQMRAFLKQYGWNPKDPRWQYLTGAPRTIRHVVTDGFHVAYQKIRNGEKEPDTGTDLSPQPTVVNPLAERRHIGYDVSHNDALIVIDGKGRIRKIYDQADVVSNRELFRDVTGLLPRGALAGQPGHG